MKKIVFVLTALAVLAGCKNTKALLPNVSGKAGEIIVVIEKADWESSLGGKVRDLLRSSEFHWYLFIPSLPRKSRSTRLSTWLRADSATCSSCTAT